MNPTTIKDLTDRQASVLVALLRVYGRDGRATVRAVAREAGVGIATVHGVLHVLAGKDLVAVGVQGGLRPRVVPCPV